MTLENLRVGFERLSTEPTEHRPPTKPPRIYYVAACHVLRGAVSRRSGDSL
jgi:hypothetical protein